MTPVRSKRAALSRAGSSPQYPRLPRWPSPQYQRLPRWSSPQCRWLPRWPFPAVPAAAALTFAAVPAAAALVFPRERGLEQHLSIIVIGGGPAGLMAAGRAAELGARVLLLEKTVRPGQKLLRTGNGRCNFTNDRDVSGLVAGLPGNGPFLFRPLIHLDSSGLRQFFRQLGIDSFADEEGRVFPLSQRASDVLEALLRHLAEKGVTILPLTRAVEIVKDTAGQIKGVKIVQKAPPWQGESSFIPARRIILATGGASYPGTGSSGDGYQLAAALGHRIIEPRPGLVPLRTVEPWVAQLAGVALPDVLVTLSLVQAGSAPFVTRSSKGLPGSRGKSDSVKRRGSLLFTHFGLSGPVILDLSRWVSVASSAASAAAPSASSAAAPSASAAATSSAAGSSAASSASPPATVSIDLFPDLTLESLAERLNALLTRPGHRQLQSSLAVILPKRLVPFLLTQAGLSPTDQAAQLPRAQRQRLAQVLKAFTLSIEGTLPLAAAMVTVGGVDTAEIDPKTLQSRLLPGLYFAGEIMDVDGYSGGYNLQAAFSSGFLAGEQAALTGADGR